MARTVTLARAERLARQHGTSVDRLATDYPPLQSVLSGVTYPDDRLPLHSIVVALGY